MLNLTSQKQAKRRTLMSFETPTCTRKTRRSALIKEPELPLTPLVLSQEPILSLTPKEVPKHPPKPFDPVYERIKRDLNSPSATARIRAQRALKSPTFCKANYQIFDVPHEEQDIITDEERQPPKPKTIREVFANCCIYVEVRTGDDNRSAGIKSKLMSEGIKINEKLYKNTTHVIFKDGLISTYKQAKKLAIPITTILWIDQCKALRRLVDPSKYPISNLERYEHPEIYGRVRRQKSMQPEASRLVTVSDSSNDETDGNDVTLTNDKTVKESQDMEMTAKDTEKLSVSSMEMDTQVRVTAEKAVTNRRITTFTPRPMEQTNCEPSQAWKSIDRRRTVFEMHLNDQHTPTNGNSVTRKTLVFNSANRIASGTRRSILDISMNIFELNCRAISENKKTDEKLDEDLEDQDKSQSVTLTQSIKPAVVRKRKLFTTENPDDLIELKENIKTPKNHSSASKKIKSDNSMSSKAATGKKKSKLSETLERRKTISFFKERVKTVDSRNIVKPSPKYIVCTNMSSTDRELAKSAIAKLGGIMEKEVSEKTTHVLASSSERTMNFLRGIIRACYILKSEWIFESEKAGMFLDPTIYQHEVCNNQKIFERSILGSNFKNLTFSHFGPFYVSKDTIDNPKKFEYVKEIIGLCNGTLTTDMKAAKIIVSDRPLVLPLAYNKPIIVITTYIFDAAMEGKMISSAKYAPKVA